MSAFIKIGLVVVLLVVVSCSKQHGDHDHHGNHHGHDHGHDHGHHHENAHGHDHHAAAPHMGIIAAFTAEKGSGFAELKLHDDKGDLELWLTKDQAGTQPFDLALDTTINVSFPALGDKSVILQVRNRDKNEDEDGKGNIRDNKTNYFIFPGNTGADASFLVGKAVKTPVVITFTANGITYTTAPFELTPHTH